MTTRVLIVDDEAGLRSFVDRVLRETGYATMAAADGAEALRLFDEHGPFDLVLIDLVMPGMRGDELSRRLRVKEPDLKVLYFTAYDRFKSCRARYSRQDFANLFLQHAEMPAMVY